MVPDISASAAPVEMVIPSMVSWLDTGSEGVVIVRYEVVVRMEEVEVVLSIVVDVMRDGGNERRVVDVL